MELNQKIRRIVALVSELTEDAELPHAERIVLCQSVLSAVIVDGCQQTGKPPDTTLKLSARIIEETVRGLLPSQSLN